MQVLGDMLVPWRVILRHNKHLQHWKKVFILWKQLMKWSLREWQSFTSKYKYQITSNSKNIFQHFWLIMVKMKLWNGITETLSWGHIVRTRIVVFIVSLLGHWYLFGGFLKWWYPTTMGFPTKNDHFGVFWGYHHLRKHPFAYRTLQFPVLGPLLVTSSVLRNIFLIMRYHSYAANGNLRLPECRPRNPRWSWRGWACSPQKWRPVRFSIGVWVVEDGGVSSNPFPFYHHWSWLKC